MIDQIAVRGFDQNFSYLIVDEAKKETIVVDPVDFERLEEKIEEKELTPKFILITHSHFDHIEAVGDFVSKYGLEVYIHKNALQKVDFPALALDLNQVIEFGDYQIKILETPGHIDDAVCYFLKSSDGFALISGDTLFVEGCGRADFPNSSVEDLYQSLQILKKLPEKTKIYPGHDYGSKPVSTIAWEKTHNKYFLAEDFEEFRKLRMGIV